MSYTLHTSVPVDRTVNFPNSGDIFYHNIADCSKTALHSVNMAAAKLTLHTGMLPIIQIGAVLKESCISFKCVI
jgi:hypothetical protein